MRLALYQPDIPQNTGAILRLCACFNVPLDVIGPTGFDMSDRALRRAGLDYADHVTVQRHLSWMAFQEARAQSDSAGRLVLLTSQGQTSHVAFDFRPADTLLLGRESSGAPVHVHESADATVRIPLVEGRRSLNIAMAAAIALAEALRQTGGYP